MSNTSQRALALLLLIVAAFALTFYLGRGFNPTPSSQPRSAEAVPTIVPLPEDLVTSTPEDAADPSDTAEDIVLVDTATATRDLPVDPIVTSDEVIARTLARVPSGKQHTAIVARLVTRQTFTAWSTGGVDEDPSQDPIWLVGMRLPNMTVSDALGFTDPNYRDVKVEGCYFAWSADTGDAYEQGVLGGPWTKTFDSIATLPEIR